MQFNTSRSKTSWKGPLSHPNLDQVVSEQSLHGCELQALTMERAATKDEKAMYETMLKISKRVEIMYETLQKETEKQERLQLQLQAMKEALEELKHNNQSLQTDNAKLKILLHEEKEEKHCLLR